MAEAGDQSSRESVLKRMAASGRNAAAAAVPVPPAKALGAALSRAAQSEMALAVATQSCSDSILSLSELLDGLPEHGLLGLLEGPEEALGLMVLDPVFLSTLIEKQTTGAVGAATPPSRRATRTDAALAADLLDGTLREFEAALEGRPETVWAAGFGYSCHIEHVRPLGLMLEDIDYRVIRVVGDLETGKRQGTAILALPAEGRGSMVAPSPDSREEERKAHWQEALAANVQDGDIRLEAVMHRFRMPISMLSELIPGEEIPIPASAIDNVRFIAADGRAFGKGRLGQSRGNRAVRLHEGSNLPQAHQVPFDGAEILGANVNLPAPETDASHDVATETAPPPDAGDPPALPGRAAAGAEDGGDRPATRAGDSETVAPVDPQVDAPAV